MIMIMSVIVIVLMFMIVWMHFKAVCTLQRSVVLAVSVPPLSKVFLKVLLSASAHSSQEKNNSS